MSDAITPDAKTLDAKTLDANAEARRVFEEEVIELLYDISKRQDQLFAELSAMKALIESQSAKLDEMHADFALALGLRPVPVEAEADPFDDLDDEVVSVVKH